MKILRKLVIDIATGAELEREEFDYSGPLELCDRAAQAAASSAGQQAGQAGATYGSNAANINANLMPFLTRQMTNPQGMSQRDIGAQLTNALAGSGGATAGLTGAAGKMAAATRNPMGFSAALDAAARSRDRAAAGAGEDVAARNAQTKLAQQESASKELGGLYGTDVSGQLGAERNQTGDINAQIEAGKSGWLQNVESIANTAANVWKAIKPGGGGGS